MVSRNLFLPKKVQEQLAQLRPNQRIALELHLENLDHFVTSGVGGLHELKNRLANTSEGDRYVTDAGGVRVVFTLDPHSRILYVQDLQVTGDPQP